MYFKGLNGFLKITRVSLSVVEKTTKIDEIIFIFNIVGPRSDDVNVSIEEVSRFRNASRLRYYPTSDDQT